MTSVMVSMTGIQTALGDLDSTWQGLMAGRSALDKGRTDDFMGQWPLGMIEGLTGDFGSSQRLEALLDKVCKDLPDLPAPTALIVATTKGAVDELAVEGRHSWPGQPWDLAANIASRFGLCGSQSTVSAACVSGTLALIQAAMRLRAGEESAVLVVGIDLLSRFVVGGFASLQALAPEHCRPFDRQRNGLALGEGAAWMLLATEAEIDKRGWPVQAQVGGWGAACDAAHITAPSPKASGLITTIQQATKNKGTVGGINAHGTATVYNDAMELLAFSSVWEEPPPCHSVKGGIGHCLGACGIIEAALAVRSLETGLLPPTVGLIQPESSFLNGSQAQKLSNPSILSCNSGFGGINAALLLVQKSM